MAYISYTIPREDLEKELEEIKNISNGKAKITATDQAEPWYWEEKGVWVMRDDLAVFLEAEW